MPDKGKFFEQILRNNPAVSATKARESNDRVYLLPMLSFLNVGGTLDQYNFGLMPQPVNLKYRCRNDLAYVDQSWPLTYILHPGMTDTAMPLFNPSTLYAP